MSHANPRDHAAAGLASHLLKYPGMRPAQTAPETLDALSAELQEVEWFGRSTLEQAPTRVAPLDLLRVVFEAITGRGDPSMAR